MIRKKLIFLFLTISISFVSQKTNAITSKEISSKISKWLISEGVIGTPSFSNSIVYKDCNNDFEIKNLYDNYKTVKVSCLDENGYELFVRINIKQESFKNSNKNSFTKIKLIEKKASYKKEKYSKNFNILVLNKSLEKNAVINSDDLKVIKSTKPYKRSFFSAKKDLIGRKLKKNLKVGQLLHPRHLYEKFDINNGDQISIVSNIGNTSVTVSGEAKDSGNLGDLIKVKNLRSGKIIKGYVRKNKIIKVFR